MNYLGLGEKKKNRHLHARAVGALAVTAMLQAAPMRAEEKKPVADIHDQCEQLTALQGQRENLPFRITEAVLRSNAASGADHKTQSQPPLPPHCDVQGVYGERKGADGQTYAVKFHLRLPLTWNERLLFQGGRGLNGHAGDATGPLGTSAKSALARGFAVVSHDSGHDAKNNNDPARGGEAAFGFDFQARKNYAHASIPSTYKIATVVINALYRKAQQQSYFFGCSKGGQEGMIAAQRYPDLFDGIVAIAPGMSLPKAAIAQAWDTQVFAELMEKGDTVRDLGNTFSQADLQLASDAFTAACDELDGLKDGIIHNFPACTADKVYPALHAHQCSGNEHDCLSSAQIGALKKSFGGVKNSEGKALYAAFPFDTGITDFGWRLWKLGNAQMPPLNVVLGMPALASVFSTPPQASDASVDKLLAQQRAFNFDQDAATIFATSKDFPKSAWQLMHATSPNLDGFKARGGKLIVAHGVSDPVFSINDTISWWNQVDERYKGNAQDFVRLFPVPGMGDCQGGAATDQFDAFAALLDWTEKGEAPDSIIATAGPSTPWPGLQRSLCAYPKLLRYLPADNKASEGSFECR